VITPPHSKTSKAATLVDGRLLIGVSMHIEAGETQPAASRQLGFY
jgi:hypothetical protein